VLVEKTVTPPEIDWIETAEPLAAKVGQLLFFWKKGFEQAPVALLTLLKTGD
jgi:hypothetical protein